MQAIDLFEVVLLGHRRRVRHATSSLDVQLKLSSPKL